MKIWESKKMTKKKQTNIDDGDIDGAGWWTYGRGTIVHQPGERSIDGTPPKKKNPKKNKTMASVAIVGHRSTTHRQQLSRNKNGNTHAKKKKRRIERCDSSQVKKPKKGKERRKTGHQSRGDSYWLFFCFVFCFFVFLHGAGFG